MVAVNQKKQVTQADGAGGEDWLARKRVGVSRAEDGRP